MRIAHSSYKMTMQTTTKRPQSSLLRRELEETLREVDAALRAMGSGDHGAKCITYGKSMPVPMPTSAPTRVSVA